MQLLTHILFRIIFYLLNISPGFPIDFMRNKGILFCHNNNRLKHHINKDDHSII